MRTAAVERLLRRAVAAGLTPGAVAGMGRVGEGPGLDSFRTWCVGRSRLGVRRTSAASTTLYDLASLTKPLATTTLCLLAMRRGLCDLRTPVAAVLTELEERPIGSASIRALMTHTAGLPAWLPLYDLCSGDRSRLFRVLGRVPLRDRSAEPAVVYSCVGFIVLGLMLERLLGASLGELFAREVARPLGVGESIFFLDPSAAFPWNLAGGARRATVELELSAARRRELGTPGRPWVPPGSYPDDGHARWLASGAGNAGLVGCAEAAATIAVQYLPGFRGLLSSGEARLATRCHAVDGTSRRGLGWQLAGTPGCSAGPALSSSAFGHTGFTGVSLWVDPQRRHVAVLLTNRHHPGHRDVDLHPLRRRFHELLFSCERSSGG